jgi:hypothetical protein
MALRRISILVTSLLPWLAMSGCASQSSDTRLQLQRINERVAILQNERDRLDERLNAVEAQQDLLLADRRKAELRGQERPALKLVRLEPEPAGAAAPQQQPSAPSEPSAEGKADDSGRVLISGSGNTLTATVIAGDAQ